MDEVLSTAPDIQDKPGATDLQVTAGAVGYHDVCFNYEDVELGEGAMPTSVPLSTIWTCPSSPGRPSLWLALPG